MRPSRLIVLCCAFALFAACEENPPENPISQFERPQDVALTCYQVVDVDGGPEPEPLPLACCASSGFGAEGFCDGPIPEARLLAFVTQTTPGEVAVVDVQQQGLLDQDEQIPFNSFVPVGAQPSDVAATWDGSRVYTANLETADISAIQVADAFGPKLIPSTTIALEGAAARLAIAKAPAIRDRYAFVTQPTLGRLTVVALEADDCPDPEASPSGCALGHLRLDAATGIEHAIADDSPEGIAPWAVVASSVTPSLYVGGVAGHYVAEIDSEILVQLVLALEQPGAVGEDAFVRRIETEEFTTSALAIEPDLERWIYAVENEQGGVLVLDLVSGELLPVGEGNPLATDAYSLDFPGRAVAVSLVKFAEGDAPDPLTFNGSFAVVSTTKAAIYVVDAHDENADPPFFHVLRSATDWYIDDDEEDEEFPHLVEEPSLEADGTTLTGEAADALAYFEEPDAGAGDAGLPECGEDDVEFGPESDFGFQFPCDPRQSSNEGWTLTWEGPLGVSGAGVIWYDSPDAEPGSLVVVDEAKGFCVAGLLAAEQEETGTYDGIAGLDGYDGDLLVITSDPTPAEEADCSEFDKGLLAYQVTEVLATDTIRIVEISKPLPSPECFGQAFTYELRADGHWVLNGSRSGHLRHGSTDVSGQCVPIAADPDDEELQRFRRQRVFEDVPFYNYYFKFELAGGESSKSGIDNLAFTFLTTGGFEPLAAVLGNNITDIEPAPNLDLILVDQAGDGLIVGPCGSAIILRTSGAESISSPAF
ncbi:MAG: hypothetical protein JRF63_09755 [Deltaproteobacteria bacterium]|nr:hypothetical protein [Deltaproteobacteria bacterium]